jgi:hypothetical protein
LKSVVTAGSGDEACMHFGPIHTPRPRLPLPTMPPAAPSHLPPLQSGANTSSMTQPINHSPAWASFPRSPRSPPPPPSPWPPGP